MGVSARVIPVLIGASALLVCTLMLHADEGPHPRTNVVLSRFPTDPEAFQPDVAPLVTEIIERHGAEEWKAALLTNELHRHLGMYSLVGVKMGIRAREVLRASLDDLRVESHAGRQPPVSCLTDGLQVATGASLGRGAIDVVGDDQEPEAVFVSGGARLRLSLKPGIRDRIRRDVGEATRRHGPLSSEYFEEIRRLSLRYWLELGRREIFTETLEAGTLPAEPNHSTGAR
jgi:pyrimidine-specific ribonucleoside hydrolase